MTFFRSQRQQLHHFYRDELGHFIFITGMAFLILLTISFGVGYFAKDFANNLMTWFAQQIGELGIADESGHFSAIGLFFNNFRAMALGIVYGLIPFLYLPAIPLGVNALLLGAFAAVYVNSGLSLVTYLAGILPHGIFELPALMLSLACGIFLCGRITDYVRHNTKNMILPAIKNVLRVLVCHIIPLLVAAALMEAYVTPLILEHFM